MNIDCLPAKIRKFLELAGGDKLSYNSTLFFYDLVTKFQPKRTLEQETELVNFAIKNPEILTTRIKRSLLFDFFFDKVTKVSHSIKLYEFWLNSLISVIEALGEIDSEEIYLDKTYIYRIQSGIQNHNDLFEYLVTKSRFYLEDPEFLTYSVVARGELKKFKILSKIYDVSEFKALFAVALRWGRSKIIKYIRNTLELDLSQYGRVLEFENYKHSHRYVYYRTELSQLGNNDGSVINSQQDYGEAISKVLEVYTYEVTVNTLDIWAELVRGKHYKWDKVNYKEAVELFRPYMKRSIPLSHDFGEFNYDVFGREWSDRGCIIEYCKQLEDMNEELQQKHSYLLRQYNNLIGKTVNDYEIDEY